MFELAFSWLETPLADTVLPSQPVTLSACQALQGQALSDCRALRFTASSTPDELARAQRYVSFLGLCERFLQRDPELLLPVLMLHVLLSDNSAISKAVDVFTAWLPQEPSLALSFYEAYLERNDPNENVVSDLGSACVRYFLMAMHTSLQHEVSPLALSRVLPAFFGTPLRFAAGLVWMVQQGVDGSQLIQTGLLHQYVSYHFPVMGFGQLDDSWSGAQCRGIV